MTDLSYTLIRTNRKTLSLQITAGGELVVRCPRRCPKREVDAFVQSKRSWIDKHLVRLSEQPKLPPFSPEELRALAKEAASVIVQRVDFFAPVVGVDYGRITIRCQKTRWGSCSAKGNLNFNCLLMLAPSQVLDYVVIHELCHRKQLNHSAAFWKEVERVCPDYRTAKQWLRENGSLLIARVP